MAQMIKRPAQRLRKRIEVRYGIKEPTLTGYSGNLSATGIMIRCTRVFGPGLLLKMVLKFSAGDIPLEGRIRWAREGSLSLLSTGRIGMGVRFVDPPAELFARLEAEAHG